MVMLSSITLGPVQFDAPVWLWLLPLLVGLAVLTAMGKSLSGLGSVTRWVALAVRLLVIALLVGALAEPSWRRESKDVSVTVVLDASQSVPAQLQADLDRYVKEAVEGTKRSEDLLGLVTAGRDAYVQALPRALNRDMERQHLGATDGTNLESALGLALAVMPKDAANRLVLATDGNQTTGSVLEAAATAKALGVPIDVLPFRYRYDQEVLVERLVAPASAREGETINIRVVLNAVKPAKGRVSILMNGESLDLDPDGPGLGAPVDLREGPNVLQLPVKVTRSGPQKFDAVFEPEVVGGRVVGDSVLENNKGVAVTIVQGEGRVLVVGDEEQARYFLAAMAGAKINCEVIPAARFPSELTELSGYDAIVLFNVPGYDFTQQQQEHLRQYVHDAGGGLVMMGGPASLGAGGWIGSPVEDALPVKLDPPQKRQMPRGALALIMHSVEAPDGVFLGKKTCEAAVNALSRLDLVGIIEYRGFGKEEWVHELRPVGDGTAVKRAIQSLMFGDMPDFTPSVEMALAGLKKVEAGQRHVIMISDGDPSEPPASLLQEYVDAGITISTVGVYPHSGLDTSRMKYISEYTKGRHYHIDTAAGLANVPQIFIKEAQTVKRSLIQEAPAGVEPLMQAGLSDALRGIREVPPVKGWVVTAEREGLALTPMKVGKENDPLLAQWQYGLGRSVVFTSDATSRWCESWVSWGSYRTFWEQQMRWVLRPGDSANVRVSTENRGDQTVVTVMALDSKGDPLNFAVFRGRLAAPGGGGEDIELRQVGPGRYVGTVATDKPGSYVASLKYVAPDAAMAGGTIEGSVQAAIARPFADEFKTLEDNMPLLSRVAEMTGGRVLSWDTKADDLWRRDGLTMPASTRPIWLAVALIALGLFLLDVGVRRVRIDLPAIARWFVGLFQGSTAKAGAQMGTLKEAREAARQKLQARAERPDAGQVAARASQDVARAKFEATPEQMRRAQSPVIEGQAPKPAEPRKAPAQGAEGDGMGRLLKAKKKAREGMDEE